MNLFTLFGLGKIKFSASIASLIALIIFYTLNLANYGTIFNLILFFLLLLATIVLIPTRKEFLIKDSKEIVIDEFLGMYALLLIINSSSILINSIFFIIFRILDLIKVWPVSLLDRAESEYGFLLDDVVLGIILGLLFILFNLIF